MKREVPTSWQEAIGGEFEKEYFTRLSAFVDQERQEHPGRIYPPEEEVFSALQLTPYADVKVLLLGQDPYFGEGQAHGLCFSVRPNVVVPPSLRNIFRELNDDLGCKIPNNGYLVTWAEQGILMLNTVLTVRAGEAFSHKGKGWETFTDAVIQKVSEKTTQVIFVLWGKPAQKKIPLIDTSRHAVVTSAHPSPLAAKSGFFGSRPFSKINGLLRAAGDPEIDWQIPDR